MVPQETIQIEETFRSADISLNGHQTGMISDPVTDCEDVVDRGALRKDIQDHLEAIGLNEDQSHSEFSKNTIRDIHRLHREAAQGRIRRALGNKLERFLEEIANGDEVDPENIRPELVEARSGTLTGDLFRFATLMWSIPVSQGYGRRLRYLVKDRANGKLIGLFALGDPVFNLRVRDTWIGWDQADRRKKLVNLMDAYVVGAVPPYADLLGGKLVTSLIASKEIGDEFVKRYGNSTGIISGRQKMARLALVTVTSALGRSSIYNRLKLTLCTPPQTDGLVVELRRLGTTIGYGHFQITDDMFTRLRRLLQEDGHRYGNGHQFGDGPNWRIRVVRAGLEKVGLEPARVLRHGIRREVYVLPIATNAKKYLVGKETDLVFNHRTVEEIAASARDRWVVPRSKRKLDYLQFRREQLQNRIVP